MANTLHLHAKTRWFKSGTSQKSAHLSRIGVIVNGLAALYGRPIANILLRPAKITLFMSGMQQQAQCFSQSAVREHRYRHYYGYLMASISSQQAVMERSRSNYSPYNLGNGADT